MKTFVSILLCFGASIAATIPEYKPQTTKEALLRTFIQSNQTAEVIKVIQDGANPNFKYEDGEYPIYPIHLAVESGNLEIVKILIQNRVNVNAKDYFNRSAIHLAARKARADIVKLLIENGALVKDNPVLLHFAIDGGDLNVIKILIENGAEVDDSQLLFHAIEEGRADILKIFIESGTNVNAKTGNTKRTPLHAAVLKGDIDIIELILQKGVDEIDAKDDLGNSALFYAALNPSIRNNREIAKILLKNGAKIFATGTGQFTFYQWAEKDNFFLEKLQEAMTKQETRKKHTFKY